jgi:hypothetical protein
MKIKSGGGIQSNKTVQSKSAWKVEPKAKAVSPAAAAQLGRAEQFRKPPLESGPGYTTKPQGSAGIAGARQGPAALGPGGNSRTIFKAGSQCPTPAPKPMEKGTDILSHYGRDVPGRR